jgi:hypothetical protein
MEHKINYGSPHSPINLKKYKNSNSSEGQDEFVLNVLKEKNHGSFVEVGSSHPRERNNTYLLEKEFNWSGLAIDYDKGFVDLYNSERSTPCIQADATKFNYIKYFEENNFKERIDYLQIDIDDTPRHANLLALIQIPLQNYRFNVITIEHDYMRDFTLEKMRDTQRFILSSLGYELVINGNSEDFWVDKTYVPQENYWSLYGIGNFHIHV